MSFINNVEGWGISREKLHSKLPDGTYKLLTLDIDFGNKCSLQCPHCFKKNFNEEEDKGSNLSFDEIKKVIIDAKDLGLESVKILGAGEPFENDKLLDFIEFNTKLDIHTCIFTKGHVLGNNSLAKQYYKSSGIENAKTLVEKLFALKTSILLGFNSFKEDRQLAFCGLTKANNSIDYIKSRNHALKLLIDTGFNKFDETKKNTSRLALICAPYKLSNIDEVFDIYKWGRKRNMYVAICPSTNSGRGHEEQNRIRDNTREFIEKSIKLYRNIYVWAIMKNFISKNDFIRDGVSLYPGGHVCNQTAAGFYVTNDGKVMRCPGRDGRDFIIDDDVRSKPLKNIWINSLNYQDAEMKGKFNFHCIARENLFTEDNFYNVVFEEVIKALPSHKI